MRTRMQLDENLIQENYEADEEKNIPVADPNGNLVTSKNQGSLDLHYPVIDLDFPHEYHPSATPGHGHLYINQLLSWPQCVELMDMLAKLGIIQEGWVEGNKRRGYMSVRHPDFKKPIK